MSGMIQERSWAEFQRIGLLWWVNRALHLFGWAIVFDVESDGAVTRVYPARVKFRGFDVSTEAEGFKALTGYLLVNVGELTHEAHEE
jgi:hypothetical protein